MAKKNNKELVQVALDSHKWVNTPVVYTTFGSNFTTLQQDIMMQINGSLQGYIESFLDEGRYKDPNRPKPIFTPQEMVEGLKPIRISLADLGVGNGHYSDTDKALEAIRELWVKAPEFDKETGLKKGENWFPVFRKVFIPESYTSEEGEEYKYANKTGKQLSRREGYIDVTLNEDVAAYVFDMSQGYFNHLERIAYFCNSAYTSRLYLLLMKHVSRGVMNPLIPYFELKDFLGMIEREKKSDKIINVKYEKFSQFRKQVLDVAMKDMNRLSDMNNTEIVFDYEPTYKRMNKRGDPDGIKFHIKRTPLGIAREAEMHRPSSEEKLISSMCAKYPTLERSALKEIMSEVPDSMWADFKQYAYKEIPSAVERPHRWDGSTESYIAWLMREYIRCYNIENRTKEQPGLFDAVQAEEVYELTKDEEQIWHKIKTSTPSKPSIEGMNLVRDCDGLWLEVPTPTFISTFREDIKNVLGQLPNAKVRAKK